jgi:hypothetical protein
MNQLKQFFAVWFVVFCCFGPSSIFSAECDWRETTNKWVDGNGDEHITTTLECFLLKPIVLSSMNVLREDFSPLEDDKILEGQTFVVETKFDNPNESEAGEAHSERFFLPEELITKDAYFSLTPPNKNSDLTVSAFGTDENGFQVNLKNIPGKSSGYVYFFVELPQLPGDPDLPRFYTPKQIRSRLVGSGVDKMVSIQLPYTGERISFGEKYYVDTSYQRVDRLELGKDYFIVFPFNNPNSSSVKTSILEHPQSTRWVVSSDKATQRVLETGDLKDVPTTREGDYYKMNVVAEPGDNLVFLGLRLDE